MRFIAWDGSDVCPTCKELAFKADVPALQRMKLMNKAECPIHGHPGQGLTQEAHAWISFWNMVAPYCDDKSLPYELIDKVCRDTGIAFLTAFRTLADMHKIIVANSRTNTSTAPNEGAG